MTTEAASRLTRARAVPEPCVPLAELVALPALAGARVMPSAADLGVAVARLGLPDRRGAEEAGVLLLCAAAPPEALPAGCVAVVARDAPSPAPAVPVVVLPEGAEWSDVVAALSAAIAGRPAAPAAATARIAFRAPLLGGRGYPGITAAARDLLGASVAVLDEYLDLLGASGLTEEQEQELQAAVERARGHGPASVLGPFMEQELPALVKMPVSLGTGTAGVVVAWIPSPPLPDEQAALDELGEAVLLERAREEARVETEARLRGDLVEELLAGEQVSHDSIVRRGRHLGADLSHGATALLGKLQDPHTEGRLITDPRLVRRFMQQTRAVLDLHWPQALVDWHAGLLVVLLPPRGEGEGEEGPEELAHTLARRLLAATRQTVPGLALTIALSRHTPEPARLGAAVDEAQLALSIGERLGRVGQVVTFEETGTYKLLFQVFADRPEELTSFFDQTLAPLVRYDEQYQTELVGTLATYLELDCNLAATAGRLFTHRHTVRYRLDRIAELSGLDIGRTDDREKLSLGLKAMRLLGRKVRTGPGERPARGGAQAGRTTKP